MIRRTLILLLWIYIVILRTLALLLWIYVAVTLARMLFP